MKETFKISKALAVILVIILAFGLFAGCGQQNIQSVQSAGTSAAPDTGIQSAASQTAETNGTAAATKYPLTLTDAKGASVTIGAKPAKIISMPLGTCEMLLSMVDKSTIAAMTYYVDDPNVSNISDAAKGVGQRLDANAEKIIALQPDLVFVDNWTDDGVIKQLRDAKINVMVLDLPSNIAQEKDMLKMLGEITDESSKAQEVADQMDQKLKEISDRLANLKEGQKLSILDYSEMSSTSGKGTNFDDIVSRAGLINPVSNDGLEGWPQLSKEMVIKYNPDIISLPSWYYDTKNSFDSLSKSVREDKALAGVKAVKNNRLISVPYNHISSTSQYSVLAVEDMAKAAYPDLFK